MRVTAEKESFSKNPAVEKGGVPTAFRSKVSRLLTRLGKETIDDEAKGDGGDNRHGFQRRRHRARPNSMGRRGLRYCCSATEKVIRY